MTDEQIHEAARELQRNWQAEGGGMISLLLAEKIVRARLRGGYVRINADGSIEVRGLPV